MSTVKSSAEQPAAFASFSTMSASPLNFDWRTWPGGVCASSSAIMPWA